MVFLDGDYEEPAYYRGWAQAADLVVAADGGAGFLLEQGIRPDVVVGDFDSLPAAAVERLEAAGVELVRHPVRKDRTDGEMAADEALRRGAGELVLAGALGALDHTLGHLAILRRLAARGVAARLAAPRLTVRVLAAPDEARLDAPAGTRVSIVPLQGDALVTLEGFDYPLSRGVLPAGRVPRAGQRRGRRRAHPRARGRGGRARRGRRRDVRRRAPATGPATP